jgi:hypothetical protein
MGLRPSPLHLSSKKTVPRTLGGWGLIYADTTGGEDAFHSGSTLAQLLANLSLSSLAASRAAQDVQVA